MLQRLREAIYRPFERMIDPYQPYDGAQPPPSELLAFYREFLQPARTVIVASIVTGLIIAILDALIIKFAGDVVDILTRADTAAAAAGGDPRIAEDDWSAIYWMLIVVVLLRPAVIVVDRLLNGQGFFPSMGALVRWRTHRHVLRQSVGFFADDFAGRIANKQIQLAPAFNDVVFQLLDAIWYAIAFVIGAAILFGELDARLLIPLAIWLVGYIATALYFVPRITTTGKDVAEARSRLAGRIVDTYSNIQTVKLFAHAEREEAYAREAIDDMRAVFGRQTRLHTELTVALTVVNTVLIAGVMAVAVWLWSVSSLTVGAIAATGALVLRLQAMTDWIMWTLSVLFQNIGVVMEGVETVSQPLRLTDAPGAPALKVTDARIRFEDVGHTYGRSTQDRNVASGGRKLAGVDGISLEIRPGEKVGLVGRSGAGKSTMVNLLLRFFDPERGRILIDDQDIRFVRQDSLRAQIGMVTQDTSLLHRTILANIVYGAPEHAPMRDVAAAEAAAVEAARRVSADEFIQDLEDKDGNRGYQAYVGERGVKLSGGQRQRIALARVVLKNAPILVLDEATSALDSEVEAAILEALEDLMHGKTVIAIAHRLSTIAAMDRIVVLDQGRVIEDGSHEALLARGGLYADLWARQSGGFLAA